MLGPIHRLVPSRRSTLIVLLAAVALSAGPAGPAPAPNQNTFSGRAFAAFVDTQVTGRVTISDTGELPPGGGFRSNALLSVPRNALLEGSVLVAATSGGSGVAMSSASLASVVALPGSPVELRAAFVRAESRADCSGVRGRSEIVGLRFAGQDVLVTGAPNQTIEIPGLARLIINEQESSQSGSAREIRVNALHLIAPGLAEVILSHAESDIDCVEPSSTGPCFDFVTGGGQIPVTGGRASFGFNAGFKPHASTPTVQFNYIDHARGMHVKATAIRAYTQGGTPVSRHFEGSCEIDGRSGFDYAIDVADNAEPGRNRDSLAIRLSSGYSAGALLSSGNVQLHDSCP
jgi:hypothetical protein